ncbi:MAG: ATP-binding cassette domain-containing protein [Gemmatimonadales bacterium]|nr:ATP-binding cassette domain-containing protein [Gemmatimonadales bacterium]NIN12657.1 ATP-binding cassette domain-containing protein [Gemmatimonadales bacterium]NIR02450.1 ATP-binding cassette domain-containing protein [Gemmatimonadales bacterium]NIS66241.1 ATP-binding cassette domain-containing protein [Gemmatimonadales bacterium]
MLRASGIEHAYGGRPVLSIESLELPAGTITALVGPNGSGKSTLLRILAFLEQPRSGTVQLDGHSIRTTADRRRARRRVTLIEQYPLLFRGTVRHNLLYALSLHGIKGVEASRRTDAALERLHVGELRDRSGEDISDGERQRVAVARALALRPAVLLLDEPTGVADRAATAQLYRVLEEERSQQTAICFASHQLEDAYRWSSRLIALADGRASAVTPENLFRTVIPEGTGTRTARVGPLEVQVFTDKCGPATIAIPADELLVSLEPLHSSARNHFPGKVMRISEDGRGSVTLIVDVGVDLAVRITRASLEELGIKLGSEVVLSIKVMAVRVF